MKRCRTFLHLLSALLLTAVTTFAQAPEPRLHGSLQQQNRSLLPGSAPPKALRNKILGPVPENRPIHGITLVFRRSPVQQADLQQLMEAQQNPTSPEFHHWLTPETFGRRFGVADSDLETTQAWLRQQGFVITGVSHARDRITFSGTAGQVNAAFSTTLRQVEVDGAPHIAPDSALSLPADLAAITLAVTHLSDLRPTPNARLAPGPAFTSGTTQAHNLSPVDLAVMYDLPPVDTSHPQAQTQSIAVVGQSYVDLSGNSVINSFTTNIVYNRLIPVLVPGSGIEAVSPSDQAESEIDLEYTVGYATGISAYLVFVGSDPSYDVFDSLSFAIDQDLASIVSISYGLCEALMSPADLAQGNALFQQASLQGQTLIAAAGDSGSTGCARFSSLSTSVRGALAVTYPADSPYVTAVGGTQMAPGTFGAGASTYWAAADSPPYNINKSLLSYVPEVVWNENSAAHGLFSTGGGSSLSLPRPSWQANLPNVPTGTTRLVPDIALQASSASPGFIFCSDDASFVGLAAAQSCLFGTSGEYPVAGGTSFATPTFATMVALLNQTTLSLGQGNINPLLYQLAANPNNTIFHDITVGTNDCLPAIPGCSAAGQTGFSAAPGYDQTTGLGSIDFAHLLAALPATNPALQPTAIEANVDNSTSEPGQTDPIYILLYSLGRSLPTAPTGSLSVSVDGIVTNPSVPFDSINAVTATNTASFTFTPPSTPGSHIITVTYPGDTTHGPSTTAVSVLVGQVTASGGVTLSVANVSLPANGTATTTVTATPAGGYNGRLLWSLSLTTNTGAALTACYRIPDLLVSGASTTTLSLGAGTACSATAAAKRNTILFVRPSAVNVPARSADSRLSPIAAAASLLLFWLLPSPRRRRIAPLLCLLLLPSAWALTGCGSNAGSGGGGTPPAPAPVTNTYTGTLTGRDSVNGSITTSTNFTITVS